MLTKIKLKDLYSLTKTHHDLLEKAFDALEQIPASNIINKKLARCTHLTSTFSLIFNSSREEIFRLYLRDDLAALEVDCDHFTFCLISSDKDGSTLLLGGRWFSVSITDKDSETFKVTAGMYGSIRASYFVQTRVHERPLSMLYRLDDTVVHRDFNLDRPWDVITRELANDLLGSYYAKASDTEQEHINSLLSSISEAFDNGKPITMTDELLIDSQVFVHWFIISLIDYMVYTKQSSGSFEPVVQDYIIGYDEDSEEFIFDRMNSSPDHAYHLTARGTGAAIKEGCAHKRKTGQLKMELHAYRAPPN